MALIVPTVFWAGVFKKDRPGSSAKAELTMSEDAAEVARFERALARKASGLAGTSSKKYGAAAAAELGPEEQSKVSGDFVAFCQKCHSPRNDWDQGEGERGEKRERERERTDVCSL